MDREILRLQANRFRVLFAAYKFLEADTRRWVDMEQLCREDGILPQEQFYIAFQYLMDEGLLRPFGRGYTAMLSHSGIKAIEAAMTQPSQPTAYFPAVDSIQLVNTGRVDKM